MVTTSAKLETTVHNQSMRLNWPCLCLWCFAQCMLWDRLQDDWSPMEWWKKACTMIAETTSCSRHFLKVRTIQTQTQSKHHPVLKSPYKWDKLARLWSAQAGCRLSFGLCWRYLPKGPTIVSYWSLSNTHPHTNPQTIGEIIQREAPQLTAKRNGNECLRGDTSPKKHQLPRGSLFDLTSPSLRNERQQQERGTLKEWLVGKLQRSAWVIHEARKY